MNVDEEDVAGLVGSIRKRGTAADAAAQRARTPEIIQAFDKWDPNAWCVSVYGDALIRIRQITEQNFHIVETFSVVAVARYVFELSVWLRLFASDRRYGLVYFDELLKTQRRFYQDSKTQLEREIELLKSWDEKERTLQEAALGGLGATDPAAIDPATIASQLQQIGEAIDIEAARRFSIHAAAARTNGYGFQAHLIEQKSIPAVDAALNAISAEMRDYDATVPEDIKALRPKKRWQWRPMADKVGAVAEYDYIYSFASKLIHATPASITTDEKNLEMPEIVMFLRYIDITVADILLMEPAFIPQPRAA